MEVCEKVFCANGFSDKHAHEVSRQLVEADMLGIYSHGIVRMEWYLKQIEQGAIDTKAEPEIVKETAISAVVDGHRAAAASTSQLCVALARKKAQETGVGIVVARNSNHYGATGFWSTLVAGEDMIGFSSTNTNPLMAAPLGKEAIIGNNPFSLAIAGNKTKFCVDISNGMMAMGKIHDYQQRNIPFPDNSWLDRNGEPTTDPLANEWNEFISLPVGIHKGYGLAIATELITSLLADGATSEDMQHIDINKDYPVSHCFMAIKVSEFGDVEAYKDRVDKYVQYLKTGKTRDSNSEIYYPGELEERAHLLAEQGGIPVTDKMYKFIMAHSKGIEIPKKVFIKIEK